MAGRCIILLVTLALADALVVSASAARTAARRASAVRLCSENSPASRQQEAAARAALAAERRLRAQELGMSDAEVEALTEASTTVTPCWQGESAACPAELKTMFGVLEDVSMPRREPWARPAPLRSLVSRLSLSVDSFTGLCEARRTATLKSGTACAQSGRCWRGEAMTSCWMHCSPSRTSTLTGDTARSNRIGMACGEIAPWSVIRACSKTRGDAGSP